MRQVDYRFQVLRNGVPYAELAACSTPVIKFQADATIMRSLSCGFRKPDVEIDWLCDRIRPQMCLDGQWHDLGVFVASSVTEEYSNGESLLAVEAMDSGLLTKQVNTEGVLHLSAGTRYLEAISALLLEAGIQEVLADDCADALTTDREDWEEGTPYIKVINALLEEIGFNPLWFDGSGVARLTRFREPGADAIGHTYRAGEDSIVAAECSVVQDIYNPANVFKVLVSNADLKEPMAAVSVNDSPNSPISTVRLGRRILAPVVKMDNIASQEALQAHADKLRFQSLLADEHITITTANMPGHNYLDTLALTHERLSGIYQETSWTMRLSYDGQMAHRARRVLYL